MKEALFYKKLLFQIKEKIDSTKNKHPKFKMAIEKIIPLFINVEHNLFAVILFLITIFILYLWIIFNSIIIPNNFGENYWFLFNKMFLLVLICIILLLIISLREYFVQCFIFPFIFLFIFYFFIIIDENKHFILFYMTIFVIMFCQYISFKLFWKPIKKKFLLCILLILMLLTIGLLFINSYTGEKKMEGQLLDCNNKSNVLGEIKCTDEQGHVIAGYPVFCNFEKIKLKNLPNSGRFNFLSLNSSESSVISFDINTYINQSSSITIPYDLASFYFRLENDNLCLFTGTQIIRYPNYEEFKLDKDRFMGLTFALLVFCLLSVPIIIKNFSELINDKL